MPQCEAKQPQQYILIFFPQQQEFIESFKMSLEKSSYMYFIVVHKIVFTSRTVLTIIKNLSNMLYKFDTFPLPVFKHRVVPPQTINCFDTWVFHVTAAGPATCAVCQMICYHLSTDYLLEQNTELGNLLSFQYMKKFMLLACVFLWMFCLFPLAICLWRKRARLQPINWQNK